MPTLTRNEVEEIALLARLHLEPAELDHMQSELVAILEHFSTLAAVDTEGIEPMTHAVPTELRLRADDIEPSLEPEQAVRGAPVTEAGMFVVPSIIPGDGE